MSQLSVTQRKLKKLLRRPDLWRGESSRFGRHPSLDTGYEQLNNILLQGGWPLRGLIECLQTQPGQGEWQLFSPGITGLLNQPGYVVLLNPPALLHVPGLEQLGFDPRRFLIISTKNHSEFISSAKISILSAACLALLCWEKKRLPYPDLRKLQLSAANGNGMLVLFRQINALDQNSPACLRLSSQVCSQGFDIQIHKQRGAYKQHKTRIQTPEDWLAMPTLSSTAWLEETADAGQKTARILPFHSTKVPPLNQNTSVPKRR